jgi:hypothetical protein
MRVSAYENVASLLIALLALVGLAVLILFLLWLTSIVFESTKATPVTLEQIGEGGGLGDTEDLDVEEVGLETDLEDPEFKDTLDAITDALVAKTAAMEDPTPFDNLEKGRGGRKGDGGGTGYGPGIPGKPRHWEVRFIQGQTLKSYAAQLEYLGIELGVLVPGGKVEYAYNLSKDRPDRRVGETEQEKRYYLTWRQGGLQEADRELLGLAGIQAQGKLVLKFLPPKLEADLVQKERQKAGADADRVRATVFQLESRSGGYVFKVTDQTYRWTGG